jgi:Ser/Thr protein kinase RdoA (MazF antagonist)
MKLNETTQFSPTKGNISSLLSMYELELVSYDLAKSGIENCTVLVTSTSGDFVLRVYRQDKKTDADILLEIDFARFLHENELPIAVALPNVNGEYISHIQESSATWQAILMIRSQGEHAKHYSELLISELAHVQARMHILAANYHGSTDTHELRVLREAHFIQLINDRTQLNNGSQHFIDRAEKYTVELDEQLPKGLCHLDFDNGNVLSQDDTITAILDFDDLMLAPYVVCLAYTLWDVYFDAGLQTVITYIRKYSDLRKPSELEKQFIVKIILFRHYVIGCKDIADNQMNDALLKRYLEMENELLDPHNSLF